MTWTRLLFLTAVGSGLCLLATEMQASAKKTYLVVEKDKPPVEVTDPKQIQAMAGVLDAASDSLAVTMKLALSGAGAMSMQASIPEEQELAQLRSLCEGMRKTPALRQRQDALLRSYPQLKDARLVRKEKPEGEGMVMTATESYVMGAVDAACRDADALAKKIPVLKAESKKRSQELLRSVQKELAFAQRFLDLQLKGDCPRAYAMTNKFYREFQPEKEFLAECAARRGKYTKYEVLEALPDQGMGLQFRFQGVGKKKYSGDLVFSVLENSENKTDPYQIGNMMNSEGDS